MISVGLRPLHDSYPVRDRFHPVGCGHPRPAAADAGSARRRRAGLPLQERRRADQRHRDGLRRQRPVRPRPAPGRLPRLRRRPAGDHHAFQRRARAGQPRHRARHERQHGGRARSRRRRPRSIASCSICWTATTKSFLYRFSNMPVLLQSWTKDRQQLSRALGRIEPNGGTAMYDAVAEAIPLDAAGPQPEESAARDL